jgi:hypothetical protein
VLEPGSGEDDEEDESTLTQEELGSSYQKINWLLYCKMSKPTKCNDAHGSFNFQWKFSTFLSKFAAHKRDFEKKRKQHYNEGLYLRKLKEEAAAKQAEEEKEEGEG